MCQMARSPFQSGLLRSLPLYFKMALKAHHLYRERLPIHAPPGENRPAHRHRITDTDADERADATFISSLVPLERAFHGKALVALQLAWRRAARMPSWMQDAIPTP